MSDVESGQVEGVRDVLKEITALREQVAALQAQLAKIINPVCSQTGIPAVNGVCAEHGGDGCLFAGEIYRVTRERDEALAQIQEWRSYVATDATGHMYRCAKINGIWSCDKQCPVERTRRLEERCLAYNGIVTILMECDHGDEDMCGCRDKALNLMMRLRPSRPEGA